MDQLNTDPSYTLIPEKEPNFSSEKGLYFDEYLTQIATLLDTTVTELKEWEDETVLMSLERGSNYLSRLDIHKTLAFKNFNPINIYISTPLELSNISTLLNEDIPITDLLDTVDPAYLSWAIEVMERHDSNNEVEITDDVACYIAMCFYEDGFIHLPENFQSFQPYLDSILSGINVETSDSDTEKYDRISRYLEEKRKELKKI